MLASTVLPPDPPGIPGYPRFGFPIAGFSYWREGQPQAEFKPSGKLQASPREHKRQHHGHHPEPLGNLRHVLIHQILNLHFQEISRFETFRNFAEISDKKSLIAKISSIIFQAEGLL